MSALERFVRHLELPVSAEEAFAWHQRPGAFERLAPPWASVKVIDKRGTIRNGDRLTMRHTIAGLPVRWVAEHHDYVQGRQFADREVRGPFAVWDHVHRFEPTGENSCRLEDDISYKLPAGPVGRFAMGRSIAGMLDQAFTFRHRVTRDDMIAHAKFVEQGTKTVAITGASGLVGSQLTPMLTTGGHRAIRLSRSTSTKPRAIHQPGETGVWHASIGEIEIPGDAAVDAVVHLAGESIAAGRWNERRKKAIRESRVDGTRRLCEHLAGRKAKPNVLVCASAIGFYGSRGDEPLTEKSAPGDSFLAEVCQQWEEATRPATEAGIRVVNLRFGIILSPQGGALANMLTPFRLGGGGVVGSGKQWWSWIALDDVVGAIHHSIFSDDLAGPVNATAPNPVTNAEFTKTLGRVLRRPTLVPLPAFAARIVLGEMADALLLSSARVMPQRLEQSGYKFRFPELEPALRHLLGKN